MSDHREYRDELAAYALGSLDVPEKLEVERHLAGCDECREYLLWLDPAVDLLPASVEPRTPPASLKRSIMGEVESDLKAERRAEKARKRSERGLWGTIWRPVTAGVLSVVLVAGAAVGYLVGGDEPESTSFEVESLAQIGPEMEAIARGPGRRGHPPRRQASRPGIEPGLPGMDPARRRDGALEHLRGPRGRRGAHRGIARRRRRASTSRASPRADRKSRPSPCSWASSCPDARSAPQGPQVDSAADGDLLPASGQGDATSPARTATGRYARTA